MKATVEMARLRTASNEKISLIENDLLIIEEVEDSIKEIGAYNE